MTKEQLLPLLDNANVKAFLKMIRFSEGTDATDGYNYLFGSYPHNTIRFEGFTDHPNIARPYGHTTSTAAGAYQIMHPTWLDIQNSLHLPDFSPQSQDIAALFLISRRNALNDVIAGKFWTAIILCNREWASLLASPYSQPTHKPDDYANWYTESGGTITDNLPNNLA